MTSPSAPRLASGCQTESSSALSKGPFSWLRCLVFRPCFGLTSLSSSGSVVFCFLFLRPFGGSPSLSFLSVFCLAAGSSSSASVFFVFFFFASLLAAVSTSSSFSLPLLFLVLAGGSSSPSSTSFLRAWLLALAAT